MVDLLFYILVRSYYIQCSTSILYTLPSQILYIFLLAKITLLIKANIGTDDIYL